MTLLFVSTNESAPWGASERLWLRSAIRLCRNGAKVVASVRGWRNEARQIGELEAAGVDVRRRWETEDRPFYDLPLSERESQTIANVRPTLVVVSQGDNYEGLGWMEECRRLEVPYVTMVMSASEFDWPRDPVAERLRRAYTGAVASWFLCRDNIALTERQIGSRLPNARIIPILYKVPEEPNHLSWPDDDVEFRLACVARLDPETKGQDLLFEVLSKRRWRQRPLKVTLFGRGYHGEVLSALRDMLELENISFGGHVGDIVAIWRTHHALVLPSRAEGLPAAIVEAMLCARPPIVTSMGGNDELVEDEVTGFLAGGPTIAAVDDALERAWRRREDWRAMGEAASRAVRKWVHPDPVGDLVSQLSALLARRGVSHSGA